MKKIKISKKELTAELHNLGIKTYRKKSTGEVFVKEKDIKTALAVAAGYTKVTDFKSLKKGDQICIEGNEIYKMMGFDEVCGEIFNLQPNGKGCSIKCKETGKIEGGDFDDGVWYIKN